MKFAEKVLRWFDTHGRKNLPWQKHINPYRVWVSEIMLQQTQVSTVIPYFERFMTSFPNIETLAKAEQDEVLKHWSGLGYYARARNMHAAAKMICSDFNGEFPKTIEEIQSLKGIGRSTGAAILSIANNKAEPILDGNVKRVLSRVFSVEGWSGKSAVAKQLWQLAEQTTPTQRNADYTQAIMDLGATLCTRSNPRCSDCPLQQDCLAFMTDRQAELPAKKPKKNIPERNTIMLIVKNEHDEVYMEKRPASGIWGGLWCFPQFENKPQCKEWLLEKTSINEVCNFHWATVSEFDKLSHTFSHFKLHIQALIIRVKGPINNSLIETQNALWYNIKTEFNGGLAAPVSILLNTLKQGQNDDKNG